MRHLALQTGIWIKIYIYEEVTMKQTIKSHYKKFWERFLAPLHPWLCPPQGISTSYSKRNSWSMLTLNTVGNMWCIAGGHYQIWLKKFWKKVEKTPVKFGCLWSKRQAHNHGGGNRAIASWNFQNHVWLSGTTTRTIILLPRKYRLVAVLLKIRARSRHSNQMLSCPSLAGVTEFLVH